MENSLVRLLAALEEYRPDKVILFGSAARGEADPENDLDVIVIKETREPFVARLRAMALLCPADVHADIIVYTPAEIERMLREENPFIKRALREGQVVYEARP